MALYYHKGVIKMYESLYPDLYKKAMIWRLPLHHAFFIGVLAIPSLILSISMGIHYITFITGLYWICMLHINEKSNLYYIKCYFLFSVVNQQEYRW